MNADEATWREHSRNEGLDPDGEVRTAVLMTVALLRMFPPSLRPQILSSVSELLNGPPSAVEQAVALAGDPSAGERFANRVQRIVDGSSS